MPGHGARDQKDGPDLMSRSTFSIRAIQPGKLCVVCYRRGHLCGMPAHYEVTYPFGRGGVTSRTEPRCRGHAESFAQRNRLTVPKVAAHG